MVWLQFQWALESYTLLIVCNQTSDPVTGKILYWFLNDLYQDMVSVIFWFYYIPQQHLIPAIKRSGWNTCESEELEALFAIEIESNLALG